MFKKSVSWNAATEYINYRKRKKILKRILAEPDNWSNCHHKSLLVERGTWGVTRCYVLLSKESQNKVE